MERPWRGSAPRTATRPAIYRTGFYRLMTGLVGWPCMRTQEVWVQGAGLGADDDRRAPCGSRDDFANGILFLLLSQDPPSPPATISPSSISSLFCGIWLALSLPPSSTLPSPGPSLPAPGHSVPTTSGPHLCLLRELLAWQSQEALVGLIYLHAV